MSAAESLKKYTLVHTNNQAKNDACLLHAFFRQKVNLLDEVEGNIGISGDSSRYA